MKFEIRTFLESPLSMELIESTEIEKKNNKIIKRKQKKKSLGPYIPFKSIYERTDFENMTKRQINMAKKYQENRHKANSLFLAVNDINDIRNKQKLTKSNNINIKLNVENIKIKENNKIQNKNQIDNKKNKNKQFINKKKRIRVINCNSIENIKIKHKHNLDCGKCSKDIFDLLSFLAWLLRIHKCELNYNMKCLQNKIHNLLITVKKCICNYEKKFYIKIKKIAISKCCVD